MDFAIRNFKPDDKCQVLDMMKVFYSSDAVHTNGSYEIFEADFENCINDNPCLEGYVFCSNSEIIGYAMISKSFSTEFGKGCIWFEDLYLKSEYRGHGVIPKVISFIKQKYSDCIFKLEVELENSHAIHVYQKLGFEKVPYIEMLAHK